MQNRSSGKTDVSTKVFYALPAFGLALIGIPIYVYLPKFYTDVVGIPIATVGALLLAVRVFDAFTDPFIGFVSDRLNTPWGRRHPLIGIGSAGLVLSILFLFMPPESPGSEQIFRFGFWLFSLFLFWTLVTIPYEALGPELTQDYHDRTTLFSFRDGCLILGTLFAAASPEIADQIIKLTSVSVTERQRFKWIALVYSPLIVITIVLCIWKVKERFHQFSKKPFTPVKDVSDIFKNRPFLILITAYTISAFGSNLPATLILFYVEHVIQSPDANVFLLIYFLTGVCCLPFWIWISKKTGKKWAWIAAMAVNTGAFSGVFFLGAGDSFIYGVLVLISGVGFGAGLALPSAIQADVIDYDELHTGRRREGQFISLWAISKKLAAAAGVGAGLTILGVFGYQPNTTQPPEVIMTLRVLYSLVPCLCNLLAMGIVLFYPITARKHEQIIRQIKEKKALNQQPGA